MATPALFTGVTRMAKGKAAIAAAVVTVSICGLLGVSSSIRRIEHTPGVTATTIRVGIPYVDVAAVKAVGVNIDWGSVPDAFNSVIQNINAHGGINGRKIIPYIVAVDPTGTAPAATACTELTQDDHVFVAIAPLMATCYLQDNVPVVGAVLPSGNGSGVAQDFTATPPDNAYDPLELSVFKKQGLSRARRWPSSAATRVINMKPSSSSRFWPSFTSSRHHGDRLGAGRRPPRVRLASSSDRPEVPVGRGERGRRRRVRLSHLGPRALGHPEHLQPTLGGHQRK